MLELVYPGVERSRLCSMRFYAALPATVPLQLTEDDHEGVSGLADKADRCAASIHRHQQLLPVLATTTKDCEDSKEQSDFSVATVGSYRAVAPPSSPVAATTTPKAGEAAQGLSTAAVPPSRSPARHS